MAEQLVGPLQAGLLKRRERFLNQENHQRWDQTSGFTGGACPPPRTSARQPCSNQNIQHAQGNGHAPASQNSSGVNWSTICAEGVAEADRKRGINLAINDEPELKQWLISDVIDRFFTIPAPGRHPPSRASALTPSRRIMTANWPGAEVYETSAAAAADARQGTVPKGYAVNVKGTSR